jgi:hypothetical protein
MGDADARLLAGLLVSGHGNARRGALRLAAEASGRDDRSASEPALTLADARLLAWALQLHAPPDAGVDPRDYEDAGW